MKKKIKDQWLEALRSGDYEQGEEYLHYDDKFCCLGVLCDIYIKENPESEDWDGDAEPTFYGNAYTLPQEVLSWSGLEHENPKVPHLDKLDTISLSHLNDDYHLSFEKIADLIEKHL